MHAESVLMLSAPGLRQASDSLSRWAALCSDPTDWDAERTRFELPDIRVSEVDLVDAVFRRGDGAGDVSKRENRESPGSCISKCHLRLDFVIWSRERAGYWQHHLSSLSRHVTCSVD